MIKRMNLLTDNFLGFVDFKVKSWPLTEAEEQVSTFDTLVSRA